MDDNKSSSSCTAEEWIQEAFYEYELIANLCNEQSYLGNASLSIPPPLSSLPDPEASIDATTTSSFDVKMLEATIKHNQLVDHLSTYSQAIDSVRNTHVRLKSKLMLLSNGNDEAIVVKKNKAKQEELLPSPTTTRRRTSSAIEEAFSNHIKLSERVIRTVMKSSKTSAECGVLFQNGMIRTSSSSARSNDHEVNVVALASLRASISQLKSNFGGKSRG